MTVGEYKSRPIYYGVAITVPTFVVASRPNGPRPVRHAWARVLMYRGFQKLQVLREKWGWQHNDRSHENAVRR